MIRYFIVSGTPSEAEKEALDLALSQHERPNAIIPTSASQWAKPQLRAPLKINSTGSATWFR